MTDMPNISDISAMLDAISEASKETIDIKSFSPTDTTELADGSKISRAGNEFYISQNSNGITYTSTYRVTDKGETITPISTDLFSGNRSDGVADATISYHYFKDEDVDKVSLKTNATHDDAMLPNTAKHQSITEETVIQDKATLMESLANQVSLVRAMYDKLSVEEKLEIETEDNPELQKIKSNLRPSGISFADRLAMEADMTDEIHR